MSGTSEPMRNPISGDFVPSSASPQRGTWPLDGSGRQKVTMHYCLQIDCNLRNLKGTSDWVEVDISRLPVQVVLQMGYCPKHKPIPEVGC